MIIVKLGGSIISDKTTPFSFNEGVVRHIADEIAAVYPRQKFVLVHGGGSYGHPLARKYGIREGLGKRDRSMGFTRTHQAMLELNHKIVSVLLEKELPAFPVAPSSLFILRDGEVVHGDLTVVQELLAREFIPVLFGDVALAEDRGIDILSGDQIITYLARKLEPEKVIFLMDVDGIYDKDPKRHTDARLVEVVEDPSSIAGETGTFDVTGGIHNKLVQAFKLPCPAWFINGTIRGNLTRALRGEQVGTRVKRN